MDEQLKHLEDKLAFETDSWDLKVALEAGDDVAVIDARSGEAFQAEHIPGAINIDWTTKVSGGAFLAPSELATLLAPLGRAGDTVVVYCRSGSRASVSWAALHWLEFDALLYDGSWLEWGSLNPDEYPRVEP